MGKIVGEEVAKLKEAQIIEGFVDIDQTLDFTLSERTASEGFSQKRGGMGYVVGQVADHYMENRLWRGARQKYYSVQFIIHLSGRG